MRRSSRLVTALTAVAVAASLAGCASHSAPPSARALAARLGCTGVTVPGNGLPAYVRSEVSCYLPDKAGSPGGVAVVFITTFSSARNQHLWMLTTPPQKAQDQTVIGHLWSVSLLAVNAVTAIGTVRKRLG